MLGQIRTYTSLYYTYKWSIYFDINSNQLNFAGDSAFCATENNITKLAGTWEKQSQASVGWFNHLTINEPLI